MTDVRYRATLDDSQVLAALKSIDRNLDKLANEGDRGFKRVGKSARLSGAQIGAMSGLVQELTRRFINLAERGARAFVQIARGGVELNRELEVLRISLTNIFEGNEEAANAFLEMTRETARRLKVDYVELSGLARTILPEAGDIEATNQLLEQAVVLGRAAGQNITGIRIALQEALAGQFISLQRRLNVPRSSIQRIKDLGEEIGLVNALTQVLGERVDKLGLDLDSLADTFEAKFALIQTRGKQLQQAFGEPIFEELKEQADALLSVLEEHGDDIERVAVAFGELAAAAVKLIGTNLVEFIDSLNFEQLEQIADDMQEALAAAELFVETISGGQFSQDLLDGLQQTVKDLQAILLTLAQISALTKAEIARRQAEAASLQARGRGLRAGPVVIGGADAQARAAGEEAYNDVMQEQVELFGEYERKLDEINQRAQERAERSREVSEATIEEGNQILRLKKLYEDLAAAEAEAAEASETITEETAEAIAEAQRKLTEIYIEGERQRTEDAIKAAQAREDIARKNAQEIEDIYRRHNQEIEDAARDLNRDEADIARRFARRRIEIDRDRARAQVDIETEFRRELERIRDRFNLSAQEAERRNDAQAFLAAMRRRDQDVREAGRTRDERVEDAVQAAEEQREKLRAQLGQEIEDAHIANRRKLEDLQLRLERELEERRIANQRDLEEQRIKDKRLRQRREREFAQELEDFQRKEAERLEDLRESLADELELVREAERLKREVRVAEAERTVQQVNAILGQLSSPLRSAGGLTARQRMFGLQGGGRAEAGQPYIVGERGPELLILDRPGTVVPNAAISPAISNVSSMVDNSRRVEVGGVNVGPDFFDNPVNARKLRNVILDVLAGAL